MSRKWIAVFAAAAVAGAGAILALRTGDLPDALAPLRDLKPRGEIAVAYPEDPPSLNPFVYEGDTNATRDLLRPVFPTLLEVGPDLRYRPALATRVPSGRDIRSDPFAVIFHLDPRAVWSDGVPVTAHDVEFTWRTFLSDEIPVAEREPYRRIRDIVVVDDRTLRLVFEGPYAAWRDLFSSGDFIIPRHALLGKDLLASWGPNLPSAGPFVIDEYEEGLRIVYAANRRWWGRGPGLERVTVFIVPSIDTALRLLDQDRVQAIAATTQLNLTRRLERLEGVKSSSRFGSAWWELAFNHDRPGPDAPEFRQAVARSVDRAGIEEALIRDEGRVLNHLPGRSRPGFFSKYQSDHNAGRDSLRRAGFIEASSGKFTKAGVPVIGISTSADSEIGRILSRAVFEQLSNLGIDVELRNPRGSLFYGQWRREGKFDLALWERRASPSQPLTPLFHSASVPPGGLNYYRVESPQVDAALGTFEGTKSPRPGDLDDLMKLLADTLPALPMFEAKAYLGFRSNVSGPQPNASIDGPFWNLDDWVLTR